MVNLLKSFYLSSLFKFKSNKEITMSLGRHLKPMFKTIYDPERNGTSRIARENFLTGEKRISNDDESYDPAPTSELLNAQDGENTLNLNKVVMSPEIYNENYTFEKNALYFFEYANDEDYSNILARFTDVLFNKKICAILINQKTLHFIKEYLKHAPASIEIKVKEVGQFWIQVFIPVVFLGLAGVIYITGRGIIKSFSKLDPVMADFSISSSNVLKFKDLENKSIQQCTICFEDFEEEDEVRSLACQHYYHTQCIDRWLIGHCRKCPCCRYSVDVSEKPS